MEKQLEKLQNIFDLACHLGLNANCCTVEYVAAEALKVIQDLQPHPWISVEDELPIYSGTYHCTGNDIENEFVYFCPEFGWQEDYEITHWMSLPQPPSLKELV